MKSLLQLHIMILNNLGSFCSTDVARDILSMSRRHQDEGDSYLTITLPKFAKALERGLENGYWPRQDASPIWGHARGLPSFMKGFLTRIFDVDTGVLLDDPDANCIWAVRQLCYLSHKIDRECTPARVSAALDAYVSTDSEMMFLPSRIDPARLARFVSVSHRLFGDLFSKLDSDIRYWRLLPKHGPGAVAERLSQKEKRSFLYWTDRLESVFPKWRYTTNSQEFWPCTIPISEELPVRVVTVPKTQNTPRIIAIEPSSMQYAQQGLKREIYEYMRRGPLSKVLDFSDQTRNRKMAEAASLSRGSATLDLSEASDRVHWWLVFKMTEAFPTLWEFLWASRSRSAEVDNRGVLPLQKFASMGSALTFPLEAMVFLCLIGCALEQSGSLRVTAGYMRGRVSVYGDDLVVPIHAVDAVSDWLEHFGAKVNKSKSFSKGFFRESCGSEFYRGTDVSVVRLRQELPSSRRDAAKVAALIDFRNRAYTRGLWGITKELDIEIRILMPSIPSFEVTPDDYAVPFLGLLSFVGSRFSTSRYNPALQRIEYRVPRLKAHGAQYDIQGEAGLLEWFHGSLFSDDDPKDRYSSQERAMSFSIQHGWTCEVSNQHAGG